MKNLALLLVLNSFILVNIYAQTNVDSNDFRIFINESHKLQNEQKITEAINILSKGIEKFPKEPILYFERAEFYRNVKKFDLMAKDIKKALAFDEDKYNAYVHAGVLFSSAKMCDQALVQYTNAINLKPNDSMAFINRAVLYGYCFNDKAEALNDINYAISIDPDNNYAKSLRNNLSAEIANQKPNSETNAELIKTLEQKLAISPQAERIKRELSMLYISRSGIFEKEKKTDEMFADLNRAVELSNDAQSLSWRGRKLCEYKHFEDAIKDFNEVIKQQPQSWITYIYRGDAYHNLNQFQKALDDYNQARTIELASEKLINSRIKRTEETIQNQLTSN